MKNNKERQQTRRNRWKGRKEGDRKEELGNT